MYTKYKLSQKCVTAARPPRPAKRRKTADSSEQQKNQGDLILIHGLFRSHCKEVITV